MVYVGAESGDNQVLAAVNKGETFDTTREALDKLGTAGITRSVMILNGLGGKVWSEQHAVNSAKLANLTQPEYLATLVVSFPKGEQRFRADFPGWEALSRHELFVEMEQFLSRLELKRTVFRSDHASNLAHSEGDAGRRQGTITGRSQTGYRRSTGGWPPTGLGARILRRRKTILPLLVSPRREVLPAPTNAAGAGGIPRRFKSIVLSCFQPVRCRSR